MADQKIVPFLYESEHLVRTIERDGALWFVLADVCRVLEIDNPTRAASRLDEDEKGLHSMKTPGGDQEMLVINESGLYSLVLTSRKAEAKRFKKWVTAEVLPSIRRTGQYQAPPAIITENVDTPDSLKLRKVNTAIRCFGERAGAQLWVQLGMEWVPAMAGALSQTDLLDSPTPPGSVTITVTPHTHT